MGAAASVAVTTTSSGEGLDFAMTYSAAASDGATAAVSPWHDVPISPAHGVVNLVCEIPKFGTAKMECDTKRAFNPIVQDVKKGKPRFYHGPIFWNYGFVPQTWEDPALRDAELGAFGDGDPLDVVEIGARALAMGSVTPVKPLGVLAMIDDGELDWKLIAVALDDPLAAELDDVADVEATCPGVVAGIREWFRWYKTPDGKPLNRFGFGEAALGLAKARAVLEHTHACWRALVDGSCDAAGRWTPSAGSAAGGEPAAIAVPAAEAAAHRDEFYVFDGGKVELDPATSRGGAASLWVTPSEAKARAAAEHSVAASLPVAVVG